MRIATCFFFVEARGKRSSSAATESWPVASDDGWASKEGAEERYTFNVDHSTSFSQGIERLAASVAPCQRVNF